MVRPLGTNLTSVAVVPVVVIPVIVPIPFVPVPAMIVLDLAIVAGPIPREKLVSFIARTYPCRAFKRRPRIVSVMPGVSIVRGVPVAIHPYISLARTVRANPNHPWSRWRSDPDSYRKLPERRASRQQH